MDSNIQKFLTNNRICSLSVALPNGSFHPAAMHYSHTVEPFALYFSTSNTSRKCQGLLHGKVVEAAVVIGMSEENWETLQLEGTIQMIDIHSYPEVQAAHYAKHPNSAKFKDDPATVFLKFTPKWWRYTDYNVQPPAIIASEHSSTP